MNSRMDAWLTKGSKTEDAAFGHVMRAIGKPPWKGNDDGMRRKKKEQRSSEKEMDGGNAHDVRDGPDEAEGCGGGSRLIEKNDHDGR